MVSSSVLIANLNKLRRLSPEERRLLLQAVLLLPVVQAGLLLLGYARLRGVMEKLTPLHSRTGRVSEAERLARARQIARAVSIAAEHGLYRGSCLRRSLLVWWFLRGEGIPGKLCFGVRMCESKLEAHAWVEYNDRVVNDSADVSERYQPLHDTFPSTRSGL